MTHEFVRARAVANFIIRVLSAHCRALRQAAMCVMTALLGLSLEFPLIILHNREEVRMPLVARAAMRGANADAWRRERR